MLKTYKIVEQANSLHCAILQYDTNTEKFSIDINESFSREQLPAVLAAYRNVGKIHLDNDESLRFVRERIIPAERQNIGQILRMLNAKYYTEFLIFEYLRGKCCKDDFFLEEVI